MQEIREGSICKITDLISTHKIVGVLDDSRRVKSDKGSGAAGTILRGECQSVSPIQKGGGVVLEF